jgi:hypothetical protein
LRLQVGDIFNVVMVGKWVPVFDLSSGSIECTMLNGFNVSGSTASRHNLLAFNLTVSRVVKCDFLSRQLSEVNFFRHEDSGQQTGVFAGIVVKTRGIKHAV